MNEFLATLTQAVLLAAVPVCSAFLVQGIRALARYASTKTDNALARKYLEDAASAIATAVSQTNQTYSAYVPDKRSLNLRDVPVDHYDLKLKKSLSGQDR